MSDAAIARGLELVGLGCKAIEVTLDTTDWRRVLKTLAAECPAGTCVGVGTVMDDSVAFLEEVAALGGRFALSPINPTGFLVECHRLGLLAVPSALSSKTTTPPPPVATTASCSAPTITEPVAANRMSA